MRESSPAKARKANSQGARSCTKSGTSVHHILPLALWARSVWPLKPVANLRALTGRSIRTTKYQLGGRDPSYADVVALLRSEHGFSFLQHLMGDATPAWWRGLSRVRSLASLRKQIAEQQRRLAQLELELD
jgi:hypothetical protein